LATVPEESLCSASDDTLVCRREGRCLVTLDMGFANSMRYPPAEYPGIVVLKPPPRFTLSHLEAVIRTLIAGVATRQVRGKLWIVQIHRLREYQPED